MSSFWSDFLAQFPATPGAFAGMVSVSVGMALLLSALSLAFGGGKTVEPGSNRRSFLAAFGMLIVGLASLLAAAIGSVVGLLPLLLDTPPSWHPVYLILAAIHFMPALFYLSLCAAPSMPTWLKMFSWLLPTIFMGLLYLRMVQVGSSLGVLAITFFIGIAAFAALVTGLLLVAFLASSSRRTA